MRGSLHCASASRLGALPEMHRVRFQWAAIGFMLCLSGFVVGAAILWAQDVAPPITPTTSLQGWGVFVGIIVTALVTLFNTWDNRKSRGEVKAAVTVAAEKMEAAGTVAAEKVEEVRSDLEVHRTALLSKIDNVVSETTMIHKAVNDERTQMQAQLAEALESIRRLTADLVEARRDN